MPEGCEFCGLGNLDGEGKPLGVRETRLQVEGTIRELREMGEDPAQFVRVSLISMSDGLLNAPWTIKLEALKRALELVARNFPNIRVISIESRADYVMYYRTLSQVGTYIDSLFGSEVMKEVACGIETPYNEVRKRARKGISDTYLAIAATALSDNGWHNMRGYFIYNLFEHEPAARVQALKDAVDLMYDLGCGRSIMTSALVLRGYVPESKKDKPLFRDFREVDDETALRELKEAASYARQKPLLFEIDSTCEDQVAASALGVMSPAYRDALIRYNLSFDPAQLVLK